MCRLVAAAGARTGLEVTLTRMTQNDPYENDATIRTHVHEMKDAEHAAPRSQSSLVCATAYGVAVCGGRAPTECLTLPGRQHSD
jgi:hypothetical protein